MDETHPGLSDDAWAYWFDKQIEGIDYQSSPEKDAEALRRFKRRIWTRYPHVLLWRRLRARVRDARKRLGR